MKCPSLEIKKPVPLGIDSPLVCGFGVRTENVALCVLGRVFSIMLRNTGPLSILSFDSGYCVVVVGFGGVVDKVVGRWFW